MNFDSYLKTLLHGIVNVATFQITKQSKTQGNLDDQNIAIIFCVHSNSLLSGTIYKIGTHLDSYLITNLIT